MELSLENIVSAELGQQDAQRTLQEMLSEYLSAQLSTITAFAEDDGEVFAEYSCDRSERLKKMASDVGWRDAFARVLSYCEAPDDFVVQIPCFQTFYHWNKETVEEGVSKEYWYEEDVAVYELLVKHGATLELQGILCHGEQVPALFHCAPDVYEFFCRCKGYDPGKIDAADIDAVPVRHNLMSSHNEYAYDLLKRTFPDKLKSLRLADVDGTGLLAAYVADRRDASVQLPCPLDDFRLVYEQKGIEPATVFLKKLKLSLRDVKELIGYLNGLISSNCLSSGEALDALNCLCDIFETKMSISPRGGKWNAAKRKQFVEFVQAEELEKVRELCLTIKDGSLPDGKHAVQAWLYLLANADVEMFKLLKALGMDYQAIIGRPVTYSDVPNGCLIDDVVGAFRCVSKGSPYRGTTSASKENVREILMLLFDDGYKVSKEKGMHIYGYDSLKAIWPDDAELHKRAWNAGLRRYW